MQHTPHHPLERTADTGDHGATSTLIERLVVVLIIGSLLVGAALAVGRLDAATDHAPDTTGAATPEGNPRP